MCLGFMSCCTAARTEIRSLCNSDEDIDLYITQSLVAHDVETRLVTSLAKPDQTHSLTESEKISGFFTFYPVLNVYILKHLGP